MKICIALFTVFISFTSLFAQNTPATKDDIKMILEQMREDNRILREDMNKRFDMMQNQMDRRFEQAREDNRILREDMNSRFNTVYWIFGFIATAIGFLFVQNVIMIKSIGKLELSIVKTNLTQEKHTTPEPLPKVQKATKQDFESEIDLVSLWKKSDKHSKQKFIQELQQLMKLEI